MLQADLPPRLIVVSPAIPPPAMLRQPLFPRHRVHKGRKTSKRNFFLDLHSIFLGHAARRNVLWMNERNDARQFPVAKAVITHGARSFGNEATIPVIRIESVADLDVFDPVLRMIKKNRSNQPSDLRRAARRRTEKEFRRDPMPQLSR